MISQVEEKTDTLLREEARGAEWRRENRRE